MMFRYTMMALLIGFSLFIIACGGDDEADNWVGTWEIESIDVGDDELSEGLEELALALLEGMKLTFYEDGTFESEHDLGKASGTYSLSGSNYTMTTLQEEAFGVSEKVNTVKYKKNL